MVVDDDSTFMAIFEAMAKELNIRLHRVTNRNHKAIGVERFHQFLNHNATIISSARQTHKCFVEVALISVYAWNTMPIDGTDKIRSIPAISRPLKFPMDVTSSELPTPVGDAAQATVSCIRQIERDARFAKELVMWLVEERQQRHWNFILYGNKKRCIVKNLYLEIVKDSTLGSFYMRIKNCCCN